MSYVSSRPSEEMAGSQAGRATWGQVLPRDPRYPRIVQAMLWLKQPTWFLDRNARVYGDVFTIRLPLGMNLVQISAPELVRAVFGGSNDALRAGEANATILEPIVGPPPGCQVPIRRRNPALPRRQFRDLRDADRDS